MTRSLPRQLNLLLLLLLSSSTASAIPASRLFARQNSCQADGFESCGSDFPGNFCCPEGTRCLSLAGDTTVLCCPEGSTCNRIESITCNLDALDPEQEPEAPIKTTVFDVELETCGSGACCPFGYSCIGDGRCEKNEDQSEAPKGEEPSTTTGATTSATEEPTSDATEPTSASPTETGAPEASTTDGSDPAKEEEDSGPDTGSIIGGVVGGCGVLLIVAIGLFILVRRRAKKTPTTLTEKHRHRRDKTKSTNGFHNIISDPILQPDQFRTDFILQQPANTNSNSGMGRDSGWQLGRQPSNATSSGGHGGGGSGRRIRPSHQPRASIPNPFNSPNPSVADSRASTISYNDDTLRTGQVNAGARLAPIRSMKASSRHLRPSDAYMNRQASDESINVFADPRTVDDRAAQRQTTFTDLMDEADLSGVGRDRAFVQVPGTTPRI